MSQVLTFRLPGRVGGVDGVSAAAGAALGLVRTGLLFGFMNAAVALWALWLFRHELRRQSAVCGGLRATLARAAGGLVGAEHHHLCRTSSTRTASCEPQRRPTSASSSPRARGTIRLFLNGNLQFAERDEYRYHGPWCTPPWPRTAPARGRAGRRRRHGGARNPQIPLGRVRHPGGGWTRRDRLFSDDPPRWRRLNADALGNPQCTIVNTDAFQWLQTTDDPCST